MSRLRRRRQDNLPSFDMTPMIDCVFQLLIFFIVCTRFKQFERKFEPNLTTEEGPQTNPPPVPREQLTIYCQWDENTGSGQYAIGVGARGRMAVAESRIALLELLPLDSDKPADVARKHESYARIHQTLSKAMEAYVSRSGAKIEKLEISFAKDATLGARSGTAPWAFVALAIDAANAINVKREKAGEPVYKLTFKYSDALQRFGR